MWYAHNPRVSAYGHKKLENWGGILSVYALLREHDPQRTYNLDALIDQAEAAEKLGKKELSISFYRKALKLKPQTERDKIKQDEEEEEEEEEGEEEEE